jgi:hypothetical protein
MDAAKGRIGDGGAKCRTGKGREVGKHTCLLSNTSGVAGSSAEKTAHADVVRVRVGYEPVHGRTWGTNHVCRVHSAAVPTHPVNLRESILTSRL